MAAGSQEHLEKVSTYVARWRIACHRFACLICARLAWLATCSRSPFPLPPLTMVHTLLPLPFSRAHRLWQFAPVRIS